MTKNDFPETVEGCQKEMGINYINGATGVLVSGTVWLISAFAALSFSPNQAIWTLLIGGALIHPISSVIDKMLGVKGAHSKGNILGGLAMEGTFFLLMIIPLAYLLSLSRTEWFFQAMLMIIGGRYLTFQTIYGQKIFWILGGLLGISAFLLFSIRASSFVSVLTGAIIEIIFGLVLFMSSYKKSRASQEV